MDINIKDIDYEEFSDQPQTRRTPARFDRNPPASNNIVRITPKSRDVLDYAVACAIAGGTKVDMNQEKVTSVNPNISVKLSRNSISLTIGTEYTRTTRKTYKMKDKN